jgi:GntR family transcriptional regulator
LTADDAPDGPGASGGAPEGPGASGGAPDGPGAPEAPGGATAGTGPPVLRIDLSRPLPPYEQLREQIAGLIAAGQLSPGTRLPSVRQLAGDLGLAPGTVARAYSELESAGLLVTRGRGGTLVAQPAARKHAELAQQRALAAAADRFVAAARDLGLGDEAAETAVRQALARLRTT